MHTMGVIHGSSADYACVLSTRVQEALVAHRKAYDMRVALLGKMHPQTGEQGYTGYSHSGRQRGRQAEEQTDAGRRTGAILTEPNREARTWQAYSRLVAVCLCVPCSSEHESDGAKHKGCGP